MPAPDEGLAPGRDARERKFDFPDLRLPDKLRLIGPPSLSALSLPFHASLATSLQEYDRESAQRRAVSADARRLIDQGANEEARERKRTAGAMRALMEETRAQTEALLRLVQTRPNAETATVGTDKGGATPHPWKEQILAYCSERIADRSRTHIADTIEWVNRRRLEKGWRRLGASTLRAWRREQKKSAHN